MYDHETISLWSTLQGRPVVGPLVDQGIELNRLHAVTTTWKEWKSRHPDTTVLSIETGHKRDYDEGVAYRDYFATDELKYFIPQTDDRLKNKSQVLVLVEDDDRLAISTEFLNRNRVYHSTIGETNVVVLTDNSAANRVYVSRDLHFQSWDYDSKAIDSQGNKWTVSESGLSFNGQLLERSPCHRAFWFGWQAQFPDTRLVK